MRLMQRFRWMTGPTLRGAMAAACVSFGACGDDDNTSTPATDTTGGVDAQPDTSTPRDTASEPDVSFTACDPFGPACPDGLTCTYLGNEAESVCVPAGDVATGGPCDQDLRCANGICMSLNGTDARCFDFCRDQNDCNGFDCIDLNNAEFSVCRVPGLYPTCNLLAQDCADEKACYQVANEPDPVCLDAGDVSDGNTCEFADSCVKGSACINGTCRKLCDPVIENACGGGQLCTTINETAVGYCTPE
jgi:hypothetical protein